MISGMSQPRVNADGKRGSRVLVVDDVEEMRRTLRRMLRWAGIDDVKLAANIAEARALIENARDLRLPFDVIFIDQLMPGGTGVELIEELIARDLIATKHTAIFVLSGFIEPRFEATARAAGALSFIEKPVSAETLVATINRWLKLRPSLAARPDPALGVSQ